MSCRRLRRGAFSRALSLAALACWLGLRPARGEDVAPSVPCGPIASLPDRDKFVKLTSDQWRFAEALFLVAPDTPPTLPPGDGARMFVRPDGTASIVFVDGEQVCAPLRVSHEAVDAIMAVGRGEVAHGGSGL